MATIEDLNRREADLSGEGIHDPNLASQYSRNPVPRNQGPIGTSSVNPSDNISTYDSLHDGYNDNGVEKSFHLGSSNLLSGELQEKIASFLANDKIPQARKDAFLSAYGGLSTSLPSQSGFDKLSEAFIGTSNYQKAINKFGTDVGALLGQYNITDYQEKYNSAEEQSSRLQNAGVNPDLQGASVDAGSSADFDDQATGLSSPSSVYPSYDASSVVGTLVQVVSGVFNWASSIQGLLRNGVELSVAETAEQSSELDYIQKLVHNSDLTPDSAVTFPDLVHSDIYNEDVSLYDKDGHLIPYSKLNAKQLDAVKSYMMQHNYIQASGVYSNYFIDDSFSENKKRRLKARMEDYLSSEQFRRKWYEDHRNLVLNRLASAKDTSDPMFNAVDVLIESCQKALSMSEYDKRYFENVYNTDVYQKLIDNNVPKEQAEQQARQILRDKADNKVLDDFRDNLLKILDPNTEQGRKADKWEKVSARIGLILLFGVRQYVLHNNN